MSKLRWFSVKMPKGGAVYRAYPSGWVTPFMSVASSGVTGYWVACGDAEDVDLWLSAAHAPRRSPTLTLDEAQGQVEAQWKLWELLDKVPRR